MCGIRRGILCVHLVHEGTYVVLTPTLSNVWSMFMFASPICSNSRVPSTSLEFVMSFTRCVYCEVVFLDFTTVWNNVTKTMASLMKLRRPRPRSAWMQKMAIFFGSETYTKLWPRLWIQSRLKEEFSHESFTKDLIPGGGRDHFLVICGCHSYFCLEIKSTKN